MAQPRKLRKNAVILKSDSDMYDLEIRFEDMQPEPMEQDCD